MVTVYIPGVVMSNGGFFGWLTFILLFDEKNRKMMLNIRTIYPVVLIVSMYMLASTFGNSVFGNRYMATSLLFFAPVIFKYYSKTNKLSVIKYIVVMLLPFILFVWMKTTYALISNPYVARSIKSEGEATMALYRRGVSGYQFIYFITALAPLLLYVFLYDKDLKLKSISFLLYIMTFVTIVMSNYFTALLGWGLSSAVMVVVYFLKNKNIFMVIMFIMATIIFLIMLDEMFGLGMSFISDLSGGKKTADRLSEMEGSFWGGLIEEMRTDRWPVMQHSIETFFKYPIIGVSAKDFNGQYPLIDIGGHSYIVDTFAIWGVLIGCLTVKITFKPFTKKRFKGKMSVLSVPMLMITLVILIFNNMTNSVASVYCLLYPYMCEVYKERE